MTKLALIGAGPDSPWPRLARRLQIELSHEADAVVLAGSGHDRPSHVQALVESGRHVLLEPPLALDVDSCRLVCRVAADANTVVAPAVRSCWLKSVRQVAALARQGHLGELYYGEGEHLSMGASGGPAAYAAMAVGPLATIFGQRPVSVAATSTAPPSAAASDAVVALVRTDRDALWKLRWDVCSKRPASPACYQVQGTGGCWESPRDGGDAHRLWLRDHCPDPNAWRSLDELAAELLPAEPADAATDPDELLLADFLAAVRGEHAPAHRLADALDWTLLGLIVEESLRNGGEPLPLPALTL